MAVVAPSDVRWLLAAFAFNGLLQVVGLWLLARQYLWHIVITGKSVDDKSDELDKKMDGLPKAVKDEVAAAQAEDRAKLVDLDNRLQQIEAHPLLRRPGGR